MRTQLVWLAAVAVLAGAMATAQETGPKIVESTPAIGASGVDPTTSEIRVTFDQDMAKGFSWTGGGEVYPETTDKPTWVDERTCVLPVKLMPGKFYRVGINSSSHRNFQSADGKHAELAVIYFTTANADAATVQMLEKPAILSLVPANGEAEVNPETALLIVTFDRAMGPGFSWATLDHSFPETTDRPTWDEEMMVCSLPVKLVPGRTYRLGLNHAYANNFQSAAGVPLAPVVWEFETSE